MDASASVPISTSPARASEVSACPVPDAADRRDGSATESARRLGTRRAALERLLGEGLRLFRDRRFDPMDLGERSVGLLARNWLGMSRSEASELCTLADGLDRFPLLREQFLSGRLSRSHARQLLRAVEPETEAGWLIVASGMCVATLRRVVSAFLLVQKGEHPDEDAEDFVDVRIRGRTRDALYLRHVGHEMAEKVSGHRLPLWRGIEILCAEFASEYAALLPDESLVPEPQACGPLSSTVPPDQEWLESVARQTYGSTDIPDPHADLPRPETATTARELIDLLRSLASIKDALCWKMGQALSRGEATAEDLGLRQRWARNLRSVYQKLEALPDLRDAYRDRRLGWARTQLLLRIARPHTAAAWVKRALEVSMTALFAQVEAMEALGEPAPLPPDDALLRELKILPGGHKRADWHALERAANVRIGRGLGKGARQFRAPPEVAAMFQRTLRALRGPLKTRDEGVAVRFLVDYFVSVHETEAKKLMGRHAVLERDGFQCTFPGCSSRTLEAHHIRFRSQGGSNDLANQTSLCPAHHRAGLHAGRVQIEGTAPDDITYRAGGRVWRGQRLVRDRLQRVPPGD